MKPGHQQEADHTPEAIARRISAVPRHSYLRDWVYGGIDGAVTTFAVVSGVIGADLSLRTILILGFANLIADGFSMAASNYLGTKAEADQLRHLEAIEHREIRAIPEGEREEVRQILAKKGLRGDVLKGAVDAITSDPKRWVDLMLVEEHGLSPNPRSAFRAATATMSAFILCGFVPLIPFLSSFEQPFLIACILTGAVFFAIGSIKSLWSVQSWWRSGLSTLSVGGIAAALAYAAGYFLKDLAAS